MDQFYEPEITDENFRLFLLTMPEGKLIRVGVWDGGHDYSCLPPVALGDRIGGPTCTMVQVGRPTNGFEGGRQCKRRLHWPKAPTASSWVRDTKTSAQS